MRNMQSADRALAILSAFDEDRPRMRVSELSVELGMHKSTVSRLLATLHGRGLVRRDGEHFTPGPELARLGSLAMRGLALVETAREPLDRLAEDTGETVNLAVRQGDAVLNVHQVQSSHFVALADWQGRTTPLHCTANGKVLLAAADEVPAELPALTSYTVTDPVALRIQLEDVRARGYAVAAEELERGLHAVAAPVFDAGGAVVAAVSVAGPGYRLPAAELDALGERCRAAADEVSALLGYRPTHANSERRTRPWP
jgi:IclR family transcriptional regulator, acetate operon repressor